jgi:hypothetical protein
MRELSTRIHRESSFGSLTRKIIGMYSIFDELAEPILVHINAAGLAMVDFTLDHCWIGARLHLKAGNSIVVNVVLLKVALK